MICYSVPTASSESAMASSQHPDRVLMEHALALYRPDIGLAIHRALEAREVARETPESPVLDLGCSDGRFASLWTALLPRPPRLLGCDLSLAALRQGTTEGSLLFGMASDGRQLPLRDGSVATVIANSVLAHVPDLDSVLAEVARVLRPGGRLLASVPGPTFENQLAWVRCFRRLALPWLAQRIGDRYHLRWEQWHRDGEAVWQRRLATHGLTLLEGRPYPGDQTGLVWSLAFSLGRLGLGRFTLLNAFKRLWPGRPLSVTAPRTHLRSLAQILAPLLSGTVTEGGSLFLVASRIGPAPRLAPSPYPEHPRVPKGSDLPIVEATLHWLTRSKIRIAEDEASIMTGGLGNLIGRRADRAPMLYCEITGYAAQFWLRQEQGEALDLAATAGECLLRVQVPSGDGCLAGAFPYGLTRPEARVIPAYFSFDAAICASALVDLAVRTGKSRFVEAARRTGEFLNRMQEADGSFRAAEVPRPDDADIPRIERWYGDGGALHGKNAIALIKLWRLTGEEHWRAAAYRTLDWVCSLQRPRGEILDWVGATGSMCHPHCYATEGLLYAGLTLDEERYLTAGVRAAEWLRLAQRRDGGLYQDYLTVGRGLPFPRPTRRLHIGAIAQAARIWWVAAQISPGRQWTDPATRALAFLARVQVFDADPRGRGAFPQSARPLGPWLRKYPLYSPWEAMFACEAVRLWTAGTDDASWSIF